MYPASLYTADSAPITAATAGSGLAGAGPAAGPPRGAAGGGSSAFAGPIAAITSAALFRTSGLGSFSKARTTARAGAAFGPIRFNPPRA